MKRKSKIFIIALSAILLTGVFTLTAFTPFSSFVNHHKYSITATLIDTETVISQGKGYENVGDIIPAHSKRITINVHGKVLYYQPNVEGVCRVPALNSDGLTKNVPTPIVEFQIYTVEKNGDKDAIRLMKELPYEGQPIPIPANTKRMEIKARLWLFQSKVNSNDGSVAKGEETPEAADKIKRYTNTTSCGAGLLKAVVRYEKPRH